MEKYTIIKNLGTGTYGTVVEAFNSTTREVVAIKKFKQKFDSWDECVALREVRLLRKLTHPNVIKLKEVIRVNSELFMVFEYMKGTVLDLVNEHKRFRGNKGLPE